MKGSLSIKYVLPAVWLQNPALRAHPWSAAYAGNQCANPLDPYQRLAPLAFGDAEESETLEAVREGTGAVRTYQDFTQKRRTPKFGFVSRGSSVRSRPLAPV